MQLLKKVLGVRPWVAIGLVGFELDVTKSVHYQISGSVPEGLGSMLDVTCKYHDEFRGPRSDYVRQWVSNLLPLKIHRIEELMHVKSTEAQNPQIDMVLKSEEWHANLGSSSHMTVFQAHEALRQ
ncbi:hypothetical protein TNCV_4487491 [Trichonephila clavipes]|nr:hypothetical protein TNCV_4487491 [Trichonephila clavipes]